MIKEYSCVRLKMSLLVLFLVLFAYPDACSSVRIDCGAMGYHGTNDYWWDDYPFTSAGYNRQVLNNTSFRSKHMNSLRFFPDQNKNCYTVPVFENYKVLVRAGFYYGNYDGLSKPPTFDLQFDSNLWVTVVTSLDNEPIFHELILTPTRNNISICVARTRDGEIPFISSLEALTVFPHMYVGMESNHVFFTEYRWNFGGAEGTKEFPDDEFYRIWDPTTPIGYTNITADYKSLLNNYKEDYPPFAVVSTMIEARQPLDPIILTFDTPQVNLPKYAILYFAEAFKLQSNQNRSFDVYFNGNYNQTLSPHYEICDAIDGRVDGIFNLTLIPSNFSNLPPIISAMELFTVRNDISVERTSEEDLQGLEWITIRSYRLQLRKWTGDPCLPANAPWEWLSCNDNNPPRVTALYLAGNELTGSFPTFSQMQALEIIDLHNNSLEGPIPEFLGELPNLKELNLADNKFEGSIPDSLLNNKKLSLNVSGNPGLKFPKKKTSKVVGLWVGGALLFVVICFLLATFVRSSRRRIKIQGGEVELGGTGEGQPIPHGLGNQDEPILQRNGRQTGN
ncbi:putative LRR receptor-like serine/threonine-protein kinase At1g51820 [Tasmannia lanceolata]|uniref:putative LRR receptor-like serine/threonine-protein kinase At1g51820 n=1 Tax=Tasmannia lanceolata TaxID=3420 RepID=UPI0040648174